MKQVQNALLHTTLTTFFIIIYFDDIITPRYMLNEEKTTCIHILSLFSGKHTYTHYITNLLRLIMFIQKFTTYVFDSFTREIFAFTINTAII